MPNRNAHARPRLIGRLILRRVFDTAHARPRPHLYLVSRPPGPDTVQSGA
jgi:hypothetical protein